MRTKKSRIIFKLLAAVMIIATFAAFFTACANKEEYDSNSKTITLVIDPATEGKDVVVLTEKTKAKNLLIVLRDLQKDKKLTYTGEGEGEKFFITSVNDIVPSTASKNFIGIYTDATDYFNNAWGSAIYGGKTFGSAIAGVSMLPVEDGKTYILKLSSF